MELYLYIFIISILFSIVGHGGASGYLAVFALYGLSSPQIKSSALILNLFVSIIAFITFYRANYFIPKIFKSIAITSIPMAFIGGLIQLNDHIYKSLLGGFIFIAALIFLSNIQFKNKIKLEKETLILYFIGGVLGFLSGLLGIGGGILLSPILLLLNITDVKQTAAISALFIFVNSLSGFIGLSLNHLEIYPNIFSLIIIVLVGGRIGAYLGINILSKQLIKKVLGMVLLFASYKMIFI